MGGVGMETGSAGQSILSTATARVPPRSDPPISFRRVDGTVRGGNTSLSLGAWQGTKKRHREVADRSSPEGRQAVLKTEKVWQTDWAALVCRSRGSPAEARTKPPSIPYGTFGR